MEGLSSNRVVLPIHRMQPDAQKWCTEESARQQPIPTKARYPSPSTAHTPNEAVRNCLPTSHQILEGAEPCCVLESHASDSPLRLATKKPGGSNEPSRHQAKFRKLPLPAFESQPRLTLGQVVEFPFLSGVVLGDECDPPSRCISRTAVKVSMEHHLVRLPRSP